MIKVVITGAGGLLGWHAWARLHAANCAARFAGGAEPYQIAALDRAAFNDPEQLRAALTGADAVLHFAGVNRAPDAELEPANPALAAQLVAGFDASAPAPHVVYANSIHAGPQTVYGRSKQGAATVLGGATDRFTDVRLPHIFGEGARPRYNNVTATFIEAILTGDSPTPNPEGRVQLLHAGDAVQGMIDAVQAGQLGQITPEGRDMGVPDLLARLQGYHDSYTAGIFPDLRDPFDVRLFNTYRHATYPGGWPRPLTVHRDARGALFEAVKGGGGGQTFFSTTEPGVTRGNHFHLHKVERFLVIEGEAMIRIRPVLGGDVWEYRVSGATPAPVDMPVLHTHSIENIGEGPLLTAFWTHDLFDPANPDTYADEVLAR